MKRRLWIVLATMLILAAFWCGTAAAASYDLYIDGVQVTDQNRRDILGDGTFVYDNSRNRLMIWSNYEASTECLIKNTGVSGLTIIGYGTSLSCSGHVLEIHTTTVQNGTLTMTSSGGDAIYIHSGKLVFEEKTKRTIKAAGRGIYGNGSVEFNRSYVSINAGRNQAAVAAVGGITLTKATIAYPSGASIRGGTIMANGAKASHVEIEGPPAPISSRAFCNGLTGLTCSSSGTWYAYIGHPVTFTEDSLCDAYEPFFEAVLEGGDFTYKINRYVSGSETLTPNSQGVYSFDVLAEDIRRSYILDIYDDGELRFRSVEILVQADVTVPSAPTGLRWDGMTARWNAPATGDLEYYNVFLYREDGTYLTSIAMKNTAEGATATYHDFSNEFSTFGQGKYYFVVGAYNINGNGTRSEKSSLYQYTGEVSSFTAAFQPGEGSGTMSSITVTGSQEITLPANGFTAPANKYFKGWRYGSTDYAPGSTYLITHNVTFIAMWTDDPSQALGSCAVVSDVTFSLNEGYSASQSQQTVTIHNSGTTYLTDPNLVLSSGDTTAFRLFCSAGGFSIPAGDDCTYWYIRPVDGLTAGTYTATLTFTATGHPPVTATVTLTVKGHVYDPNEWESNSEKHWNKCEDCSLHINEAPHDSGTIQGIVEPTFDTDGFSGNRCCTVCGRVLEKGHVVAAGKYIRTSRATMTPAALTNAKCANDLEFASQETGKYTVHLTRAIDKTDSSLNTSVNLDYPHDEPFVAGHVYIIEFEFTAVAPYVYNEDHGDYISTFTLNGASTQMSSAVSLSGSTLRQIQLTATTAEVETWGITFNANGGTGSMPGTTVEKGKKYTLPACGFNAPYGKVFDKWDKGTPGTEIDISGNTVITALWKDKYWNITFAANGGGGTMVAATVVKGDQYTLPLCGFSAPTGKTFDKWDLGVPGTQINITADTVITAQWKDRPWAIVFHPGEGSGTMNQMVVDRGEKLTLPACTFTAPVDKVFDRWDKGAPGEEIEITGNTHITALWKEPVVVPETWTISFNAGSGTGEMAPATVNKGEKFTLPACSFTAPENKTFDQWDKGAPGTQIDVFADTIVTAMWKDKPADPAPAAPSQPAAPTAPAETEQVTLKKLKSVKLKAVSAKKLEISWKKLSKKEQKKIQKIEIQYSTDKTFQTDVKTKWAKKGKASYTIKGLKKNTKYWVRIRAWKKDGNITYVSKWVTKSKKTKKK